MGATKASVIQDNNNILLNRKHPVLARTHLYTAQTTIRRVLANNEYTKHIPAIVISFPSVRYLQYYFLSLFIAIFPRFNQEVHKHSE